MRRGQPVHEVQRKAWGRYHVPPRTQWSAVPDGLGEPDKELVVRVRKGLRDEAWVGRDLSEPWKEGVWVLRPPELELAFLLHCCVSLRNGFP